MEMNIEAKLSRLSKMDNRKKEDKKLEEMSKVFGTEMNKRCLMQISSECKNNEGFRESGKFHKTSKKDIFKDGVIPICKDCSNKFIIDKGGEISREKFKELLKIYDLPFITDDFNKIPRDSKDIFGDYIRGKNRTSIYNYDCSHHLGTRINAPTLNVEDKGIVDANMDDLRFVWGDWFEDKDLLWLEQTFINLKKDAKTSDSSTDDMQLREICHKQLDIRQLRKNGQSTDKSQETLLKMLDSAKLTAKSNKDNKDEVISPLGVRIQEMEKKTPCEVFEDRKLFKDYDGILEYIKRFILRPLINFITSSKEFDKEFNVEEAEKFLDSED